MATLKFDEQKDVFIGVKLPIQNGQQGYFDSSLTTIDQVKTNIRNLLLTIKGERLMHPEFGTDINPSWVHISYVDAQENRNRCLKAYKKNGKTKYMVI